MKRVTFDTNTFDILNGVSDDMKAVGKAIRQEIENNKIKGFISGASVFVECLGFPEKLEYLAVAGTPDPRPSVDQRRIEAISELQKLGFEMLHAPLIGAEIFIQMPWATDERYPAKERQNRFSATYKKYGHPQNTVEKLRLIGNELLNNQDPLPENRRRKTENGIMTEMRQKWAVALRRDWENGDKNHKERLKKQLGKIIGEWCDILIISSHEAYGNDIFCTNDEGKKAGANSLLHHSNREKLNQDGINVVLAKDLLSHL